MAARAVYRGDPPVQTGNLRVNPVVGASNVCHTYWYVQPSAALVSVIWQALTASSIAGRVQTTRLTAPPTRPGDLNALAASIVDDPGRQRQLDT